MFLLAAGLCGAAAWWGTPSPTKPIAEIQLGERVHAVNPLGAESDEPEPTPETHRRVVFRMDKGDGEAIDFELLWPLERIRTTGAVPGSRLQLSMAELGGSGVAEVLAIGPCPPIARGTGSLVTSRFVHRVERVLEVETDDGTTIGTTPNHPFWSEATGSYRPIGEFRVGDRVRTRTGQLARLTSITPRDGPTTVYNLTVHGQHVYHVGPAGVLVHNKGPGFGKNATESPWNDFQRKYKDEFANSADAANGYRLQNELLESKDVQRGLLRERMAEAGHVRKPGEVTHHVIPLEATTKHRDLMERAARGGYDINGANNGIFVDAAEHVGGHPKYNEIVLEELSRIEKEAKLMKLSDAEVADRVQRAADTLRTAMDKGTFGPWF